MKAKLDIQVQTLQSAYFNLITSEGKADAVISAVNTLLDLFITYKTQDHCIYHHPNLSELLLNQALAENFILPNLRDIVKSKAYEGAVFELLMAAKAPAELVAKFASSLQPAGDTIEDLIRRGLQELREIYSIAEPLYRDGNTQKLNDIQVQYLLMLTQYSAALRALARHYNIAAGESTQIHGDEVRYVEEIEITNRQLADYFKQQAELREAQEEELLRAIQTERASGSVPANSEQEDMIDHSLAAVLAAVNLRQVAIKKPKVEVKQVLVEAKKQANLLDEILRVKGSLRKQDGKGTTHNQSSVSDELAQKLARQEARAAAGGTNAEPPLSPKPMPPRSTDGFDPSAIKATLRKAEPLKKAAASPVDAPALPAFDPLAAKAGLRKTESKKDVVSADNAAPMAGMDSTALLKSLKKAAPTKVADAAAPEQVSFKHVLKPVAKGATPAAAASSSPAPANIPGSK